VNFLLSSMQLIIFGVCVVLPWVLVVWALVRWYRWATKGRKTTSAGESGTAPPPAPAAA
jgi:hypothetical protein